MKRSAIEWTDFSGGPANFVRRGKRGDCECSPGCERCYALRIGERFKNLPDVTTFYPDKLEALARAKFPQDGNKRGPYSKPMVFVVDTGDLFHPNITDDEIGRAFGVFARRQDVTWQVLTKRAERMRAFVREWAGEDDDIPFGPLPNVWLGITAENQTRADERIPVLLATPAAVRFVSLEPLLGPMDLRANRGMFGWMGPRGPSPGAALGAILGQNDAYSGGKPLPMMPGLDWLIVGGETSPGARPMHPDWVRDIQGQCAAAGVPFFMKQMSRREPIPEDLFIREYPR